jgi:phytoene synthase
MTVHAGSRGGDQLLREARATHRAVGRTFWLASRLLPRAVRDDTHRLYLVLRTLDDVVDHHDPNAEAQIRQVEAWATLGEVDSGPAALLEDIASRHPIERAVVLDFCRGMRDDLERRVIATEADLDTYCYRVAGTVGVLMTTMLGADDPAAARGPAIALGQAMQRTNILRDVDEDLEHGRIYLSAESVARFGSLLPGERADLLRDQIARADALYEIGIAGICHLRSGRLAVTAAAGMYREILRQIERDGLGAHAGRSVAPLPRKVTAAFAARRQVSREGAGRSAQ